MTKSRTAIVTENKIGPIGRLSNSTLTSMTRLVITVLDYYDILLSCGADRLEAAGTVIASCEKIFRGGKSSPSSSSSEATPTGNDSISSACSTSTPPLCACHHSEDDHSKGGGVCLIPGCKCSRFKSVGTRRELLASKETPAPASAYRKKNLSATSGSS